jgi:hypothetical protein
VMTSEAESKVILQLLLDAEAGVQDVLPTGENTQETVGRVAEFDETARLDVRQTRFKKWGRAANLRDERLWSDPLSPGARGRFDERCRQTTSMNGACALVRAASCFVNRSPP